MCTAAGVAPVKRGSKAAAKVDKKDATTKGKAVATNLVAPQVTSLKAAYSHMCAMRQALVTFAQINKRVKGFEAYASLIAAFVADVNKLPVKVKG